QPLDTHAVRRGAPGYFFAAWEPLGPSPCLRCCVLQQPKRSLSLLCYPRAPQGYPRDGLGFLRLPYALRTLGTRATMRSTHRGRSSRARERRGFPFVIKGLAQGSAGNDVILKEL